MDTIKKNDTRELGHHNLHLVQLVDKVKKGGKFEFVLSDYGIFRFGT